MCSLQMRRWMIIRRLVVNLKTMERNTWDMKQIHTHALYAHTHTHTLTHGLSDPAFSVNYSYQMKFFRSHTNHVNSIFVKNTWKYLNWLQGILQLHVSCLCVLFQVKPLVMWREMTMLNLVGVISSGELCHQSSHKTKHINTSSRWHTHTLIPPALNSRPQAHTDLSR